jgi:hypothetical protein
MPNNPTCKESLQVHAARLRKMAEQMPSMGQRTRAALLAGAEALERQQRDLDAIKAADAALNEAMETINDLRGRLEAAKIELWHIASGQSWSPTRDATDALERLESKGGKTS